MFKSLGQFHGGVMGGYAKLSVNNIIDIEEEPMKGSKSIQPTWKGWVVVILSLYGFHNLFLDDNPPFKGQFPLPKKET
jgi:hypothetical protein